MFLTNWKRILIWIALREHRSLTPLVYAQMMHESDRGRSPLAKKLNNYFGMTTAINRYQLGRSGTLQPKEDGKATYQQYNSFFQSVRDYKLWLDYTRFPKQIEQLGQLQKFVNELKERKYFGDTKENYFNGLRRFV
jgi:uncharacterized FlgJ-related protein